MPLYQGNLSKIPLALSDLSHGGNSSNTPPASLSLMGKTTAEPTSVLGHQGGNIAIAKESQAAKALDNPACTINTENDNNFAPTDSQSTHRQMVMEQLVAGAIMTGLLVTSVAAQCYRPQAQPTE
jgi:hypothetical protein